MEIIADTNVWYDIGANRRDPTMLKSGGNRLLATPTSILEIVSLVDDHNLNERKQAAKAIIDHADLITFDCEYHLTQIWKLNASNPSINWKDPLIVLSNASTVEELGNGVRDNVMRVSRKVDIAIARQWRIQQWNDFKEKVEDVLDQHISGYSTARKRGKIIHLKKSDAKIFIDTIRSTEIQRKLLDGTFERALLVAKKKLRSATEDEIRHAKPLLQPYIDAYTEYIIKCATSFAPQSNDLGDIECFLYLQSENRFLTSDRRWMLIAKEVCPEYYYDPEDSNSTQSSL